MAFWKYAAAALAGALIVGPEAQALRSTVENSGFRSELIAAKGPSAATVLSSSVSTSSLFSGLSDGRSDEALDLRNRLLRAARDGVSEKTALTSIGGESEAVLEITLNEPSLQFEVQTAPTILKGTVEVVKLPIPEVSVSFNRPVPVTAKVPAKPQLSISDKILSVVAAGALPNSSLVAKPVAKLAAAPVAENSDETVIASSKIDVPGFRSISLEELKPVVSIVPSERRRLMPVGFDESRSVSPDEGIVSDARVMQRLPRMRPDIDTVVAEAKAARESLTQWASLLDEVDLRPISIGAQEQEFAPGSRIAQAAKLVNGEIAPSNETLEIMSQLAMRSGSVKATQGEETKLKDDLTMVGSVDAGLKQDTATVSMLNPGPASLRIELSYVTDRDDIQGRVQEIANFFPQVLQERGRWYGMPVPNGEGVYAIGIEAYDQEALEDLVHYTQVMNIPMAQRRVTAEGGYPFQ
jgi:hypothetical protein